MKKELELRQNQEVSKLQVLHTKAKKSGFAPGFNKTNLSFVNSTRIENSRFGTGV